MRHAAVGLWALLVACACDGGSRGRDASVPVDGSADAAPPLDGSRDGGAPMPTERCPGVELDADRTLALDLPAFVLEGAVTLDGAALPDEPRGAIAIRGDAGEIVVELGASGPGRYRALLVPGDYELRYVPAGCPATGRMPCAGAPLATARVASDGVLDLDVPSVTVRGTVRAGAEVVPAQGSVITFGDARVSWDDAGAYEVRLVPGDYAVGFEPGAVGCGDEGGALPCVGGALLDTSVASDGVLDLDIPAVEVRGRVMANGGAIDAAGALAFEGEGGTAEVAFDASGAYLARLWPGRYRVAFGGSGLECGASTPLPCNGGPLLEDAALMTSGVLDVDVPSVLVSGRVRVDGAPPAAAGALELGAAAVAFDAAGDYRARLMPGTYDVRFVGAGCAGRSELPCNGGIVLRDVALATDGVLDVPVATATVIGRVTVSGAAPEAGAITFEGDDAGPASAAWLADGSYELTLLRGTYRAYVAPSGACDAAGSLPCHATQVLEGLALSTDGVADVDVPVVAISGTLRAGGAAIDGEVRFRGAGAEVTIAAAGSYAVRLAPGAWDIDYVTSACEPAAPCVSARAHTALDLSSDGVVDVDVPMVRVGADVSVNGAATPADARARVTFVKLATDDDPVADEVAFEGAPLRLVPGLYLVTYDGGASACDGDRRWPCLSRVLAGCVEEP